MEINKTEIQSQASQFKEMNLGRSRKTTKMHMRWPIFTYKVLVYFSNTFE